MNQSSAVATKSFWTIAGNKSGRWFLFCPQGLCEKNSILYCVSSSLFPYPF